MGIREGQGRGRRFRGGSAIRSAIPDRRASNGASTGAAAIRPIGSSARSGMTIDEQARRDEREFRGQTGQAAGRRASGAATAPNWAAPRRSSAPNHSGMPAPGPGLRSPSEADADRIGRWKRRGFIALRDSTPMPKSLTKVAKATAAVSARPGASERQHETAAELRKVKALKQGLEHEPFADECRRAAAWPRGSRQQTARPVRTARDHAAPRRNAIVRVGSAENSVGGRGTSAPLASAWPARCRSATIQASPARSASPKLRNIMAAPSATTAIEAFSAEEKLSRSPPIVLLEGVEDRSRSRSGRRQAMTIAGAAGTRRARRGGSQSVSAR